ncbi:9724_t:CDS:10, partial [Dentiscutata heterogama]
MDTTNIIKTKNRHSGVPYKSFDDFLQENPAIERTQSPPNKAENLAAPESWAVNLTFDSLNVEDKDDWKRLKWLEQAGYTINDNLENIGREDNSYLVRFTLPEAIVPRFEEERNLSNFQIVDLQSCNLLAIPIFLYRQALNIRSLNVSQNLMLNLPFKFELLERLGTWIIGNDCRANKSSSLKQFVRNITREICSVYQIKYHESCQQFVQRISSSYLRYCDAFDLSYNEITSIPEEIGKHIHLKKLDICRNKITNLCAISLIPNLEILLTEFNDILTVDISSRSLQKLILSKNQLTQFSLKETGPSLKELSLANAKLVALPNELFEHLESVQKLDISNNHEISSLDSLYALDIHFNNPGSIPQEIWLCKSLAILNVSSNLLEQFPASPTNLLTKNSLISSLRALYLGDNSITAEIFSYIYLFSKLEILNISFNMLDQIPPGISNPHLTELYLSGNQLSSLPEDIDKLTNLSVLHVNGNRLTTLPAELSKIRKLMVLDIKHVHQNEINPLRDRNLADFRMLTTLRVLGLMDITLLNFSVPEETDNRRVRTSVSLVNSMRYGMADTLGKADNLSTWEAVTPKFRGHEDESIFGLFDARAGSSQGGQVTKYLHDWFLFHFKTELENLKDHESVESALRRSFLSLNKELGLKSGASGLVAYISGTTLYIANVGDAVAVISRKKEAEIERIRQAGGYISHDCLVNGELDVSRSFGHFHLISILNANPIMEVAQLSEQDEFLILATRELWNYISYQLAVDIARTENDLMLAAQKLKDFAIFYGADKNIMVMIVGVGDLFDRRYTIVPEKPILGQESSVESNTTSSKITLSHSISLHGYENAVLDNIQEILDKFWLKRKRMGWIKWHSSDTGCSQPINRAGGSARTS